MTTAIFDANDFTSYTVDIPNGQTTITDTGNINIILTTGVNQPVFKSLSTALKCLNFMNARNQCFIMAGDDITIVNCQTKLIIFEECFSSFLSPFKKLKLTKKLNPAIVPPHFLTSSEAASADPPVANKSSCIRTF